MGAVRRRLSTSVLINQPGGQTLPVPIFNQMHIGSTAEVAALSLTLFALCGGALLLGAIIMRFFCDTFHDDTQLEHPRRAVEAASRRGAV
jgi:hypothetical protein